MQLLPFELVMIMVSYCAAEESFNMIRLSREMRSFVLAAKLIIYKQLFCRPGAQLITAGDI